MAPKEDVNGGFDAYNLAIFSFCSTRFVHSNHGFHHIYSCGRLCLRCSETVGPPTKFLLLKINPIYSFTPEKLGMLTTNALFYIVLENLIVFVMKYALNISQSLNIWHALAYSSYKFTGYFCLFKY